MKVYVATDLEGVTGVFHFGQTREKGSPENQEACRLLMHDIAAVVAGLKEAGVDEILVMDGHGGANSFIPEMMAPGARYLTGKGSTWHRLEEGWDGLIMLGYHAMNGVKDGVLHHTGSSKVERKCWYDGVERGELFQQAVLAGSYDIPVMLVTGDEAICREARETLGEATPTVAVKKGICREAAVLIPPEETYSLLKEGAKRAVAAIPDLKPYKIKLPVKLRVRMIHPPDATLDNPYYAEYEGEVTDPKEISKIPRS